MKEKILNVKNILRIVISVLVIFSMLKSCANAWTFEDFIDLLRQTQNMGTSSRQTKIANVLSKQEAIANAFINNNDNIDNYNSFILYYDTSWKVSIYAKNNTQGTLTFNSNNSISFINTGTWKLIYGDNTINITTDTLNSNSMANLTGLVEYEIQTWNNLIFNNYYNYINVLPRTRTNNK